MSVAVKIRRVMSAMGDFSCRRELMNEGAHLVDAAPLARLDLGPRVAEHLVGEVLQRGDDGARDPAVALGQRLRPPGLVAPDAQPGLIARLVARPIGRLDPRGLLVGRLDELGRLGRRWRRRRLGADVAAGLARAAAGAALGDRALVLDAATRTGPAGLVAERAARVVTTAADG